MAAVVHAATAVVVLLMFWGIWDLVYLSRAPASIGEEAKQVHEHGVVRLEDEGDEDVDEDAASVDSLSSPASANVETEPVSPILVGGDKNKRLPGTSLYELTNQLSKGL